MLVWAAASGASWPGSRSIDSLGRSRRPIHSSSGRSARQAALALRAVDLPVEVVLAPGADLGERDDAAGAAFEADQQAGGVLGLDAAVAGLLRHAGR